MKFMGGVWQVPLGRENPMRQGKSAKCGTDLVVTGHVPPIPTIAENENVLELFYR